MKKVFWMLILVSLFVPLNVKGKTDCGNYLTTNDRQKINRTVNVYIDDKVLKAKFNGSLSAISISEGNETCPYSVIIDLDTDTACTSLAMCDLNYDLEELSKNGIYYCSYAEYVNEKYAPAPITHEDIKTNSESRARSEYKSCNNTDVNSIYECGCMPAQLTDISSAAYFILRVIGPVLLIILGGIDMAKAIATEDDSAIKKAKTKLIKKAIAAASIFFVLTLFEFVVTLIVSSETLKNQTFECLGYLLNGYKV